MKTVHSEGHDLHFLRRIIRYHHSSEVRKRRKEAGDTLLFCLCDFCNFARKVLESLNNE